MTQLRLPGRSLVSKVKNFTKIDQIQKFNERQKSAKWAQLFAAGFKLSRGIDFYGTDAICKRSFTSMGFPAIFFRRFTIWVPPL